MKIKLVAIFMLSSVLAFSQASKKVNKKPVLAENKAVKIDNVEDKVAPTDVVEQTVANQEIVEISDYQLIAKKVLEKKGFIKNRNSSYVRGIEGYVKGTYVGQGKLYILLELANRTNINYDIESASFITNPIEKKNRQIEMEEKIFTPVYSTQPETLSKKSSKKVVYVFDKFNISDSKTLLFIMSEIDGERTLTLEIKPKFIIEADYIK